MKKSTQEFFKDTAVALLWLSLFVFMIVRVITGLVQHDAEIKKNVLEATLPVLIEDTTGKCISVYEPKSVSFHACWPETALPPHKIKIVPKDTTSLDLFKNPDKYLD